MAAKTKKRNPQDATLRNITAGKRRTTILEARVSQLKNQLTELATAYSKTEAATTNALYELERKFTLLEEQFKNSLTPPA